MSLNEFLQGTYFKFQQRERSLIDRWVLVKRVANYSLVLILPLLKPNSYNKVAIETGFPCIPTV